LYRTQEYFSSESNNTQRVLHLIFLQKKNPIINKKMIKTYLYFLIIFSFQNLVFSQKTDYDILFNTNREQIVTNIDVSLVKCKEMEALASKEKSEYGLLQTYKLYSEIFIARNEYKKVLNYSQKTLVCT
jgi:hypothetical protein